MKLSPSDRLEALRYSDKYRQDYEDYKDKRDAEEQKDYFVESPHRPHVKLCKPGKALCRKWGLIYPIDPDVDSVGGDF
jgi:hypothetical protein